MVHRDSPNDASTQLDGRVGPKEALTSLCHHLPASPLSLPQAWGQTLPNLSLIPSLSREQEQKEGQTEATCTVTQS